MKYLTFFIASICSLTIFSSCSSEKPNRWKEGIVNEEFIYDEAPYPSCHAGTIVETTDGTLVTSWFGGTWERNPDVCIYVSRKVDGKWTEPENVADGIQNDTLRYPTWNPVLYQVPNGELQLYYKVGPHPKTWEGWMKTSDDDGVTWSEAKKLPDGVLGPIKDKPVLVNGKLISPSSTEDNGWQVHFEISNDFGKTWLKTDPINEGHSTVAIQPTILIHADGSLQALCRSKNRAILQTWSKDGGETWSALTKTSLPQNNSGIDAITLADGRQLLVYNHVLPPGEEVKGGRSPLNVAVSEDGENWMAALVLEDEPDQRFSYPAVIQTSDGLVHIFYTWKRKKMKHVVVDPDKLVLTPIVDGKWPE